MERGVVVVVVAPVDIGTLSDQELGNLFGELHSIEHSHKGSFEPDGN